jgi:PPOX class probable FMN-dependent enzyme
MVDLAPWRSPLSRALHRNRALPYARYFQLATVRQDGTPANRTVVFRGFSDEGVLQMATDRRSEKVQQIAHNNWGEACWYFPKTREQFRLTGTLSIITADDDDSVMASARHHLWESLSDSGRSQFTWPHPGHPRADDEAFQIEPPSPNQPLPDFCLLLLAPTQVDHLELKGTPQDRHRYRLKDDRQWSIEPINP